MTITVYSRPGCVQCNATSRALDKANLQYEVVDVTEDTDARDYVMSLGHLRAPVVVADDRHWSGYRPDQIKALAEPARPRVAIRDCVSELDGQPYVVLVATDSVVIDQLADALTEACCRPRTRTGLTLGIPGQHNVIRSVLAQHVEMRDPPANEAT